MTRAQTLLNKLGYNLFQSRYGLGETGEASAQVVAKLEGLTS